MSEDQSRIEQKDLDFKETVKSQIRSCLESADYPDLFAIRVDLLRIMLPQRVKDSDDYQEKLDDCTESFQNWQYSYCCNIPMGTPEKPVLGSPFQTEQEVTDWNTVFELCLHEFERMGITWQSTEIQKSV